MDTNIATEQLLRNIPLNLIIPDPDNVRVVKSEKEEDADLIASIKAQGVLQPILVRPLPPEFPFEPGTVPPPEYMVIFGHRRFAAAQAAGLDTIPAVIREGLYEGEVTLMQLTENLDRADMSVIDIWQAVETAGARGLSDATIAAARNISVRQVEQYRAMGRLHPLLKEQIRKDGDVPDSTHLRVICQASHERQAEAFNSFAGRYSGHALWAMVAHGLKVKRVPMKYARFDPALYEGPTTGDLFAAEADEMFATDVPAFMELQRAWVDSRVADMVKAGFYDAAVLEKEKYHSEWVPPAGAKGMYDKIGMPKKLPKKADREQLIYGVGMAEDGQVTEYLYERKPAKVKAEKKPKPAADADPLEGASESELQSMVLTSKGLDRLEVVKRQHLAAALDADSPLGRNPDEIIAMLAMLLCEKVSGWHNPAPSFGEFIADDGSINIDGKADELNAYARRLIGFTATGKAHTGYHASYASVQRIGAWLGARVAYPATQEDLDMVKGPGLALIKKALRFDPKIKSTQRETRKAIMAKVQEILPEHLGVVGWKVEPKPQARFASIANTGVNPAEVDWDEDEDQDPDFCGRREGRKGCPCGWPEDVCGQGEQEKDEAEQSQDAAVAAVLAAPEPETEGGNEGTDTVEEDMASWEQEREEQGSDAE